MVFSCFLINVITRHGCWFVQAEQTQYCRGQIDQGRVDEEVEEIVSYLKSFGVPDYVSGVVEARNADIAEIWRVVQDEQLYIPIHHQVLNWAMTDNLEIEVDPETYEVRADGELLTCEPADVLPMAQRYFLY